MSVQGPIHQRPVHQREGTTGIKTSLKQQILQSSVVKAVKQFLGHKVALLKGNNKYIVTVKSSTPVPSTPLLKRKGAIYRKNNPPQIKRRPDPMKKQQLREGILDLKAKDYKKTDQWVLNLKSGLAAVSDKMKSEGIKDITMDLKLDRLLQDYQFDATDYDILVKLQDVVSQIKKHKDGSNVVEHLMGKISLNMVKDIGFKSSVPGDRISARSGFQEEAVAARKQFLVETDLSSQSKAKVQKTLTGIIGRPYGLRADLSNLKGKLGDIASNISSKKESRAIEAMREDISELLGDSDLKTDILEVNRLVLKMAKKIQSLPSLRANVELSGWPDQYPTVK